MKNILKERNIILVILAIVIVLAVLGFLVYYFSVPVSKEETFSEPENEGLETREERKATLEREATSEETDPDIEESDLSSQERESILGREVPESKEQDVEETNLSPEERKAILKSFSDTK
jgi:hypothetical protein